MPGVNKPNNVTFLVTLITKMLPGIQLANPVAVAGTANTSAAFGLQL